MQLFLLLLAFGFRLAQSAPVEKSETQKRTLTYVTLEEHFDSRSILKYQEEDGVYKLYSQLYGPSANGATLANLSVRIPDMDKNDIRIQIVGQDPQPYVMPEPEIARSANSEMATAISQHPDRFRGHCFLPMAYPDQAAEELERCVSQLGFVGALVDDHLLNYTFYDGPAYDHLFDVFERLDVPLYLHPTYPPVTEVNGSKGLFAPDPNTYSDPVAAALGTAGWGWHSDTGVAFVRMWFSGVFDRHPNLKVVFGHMGEMVPYMLHRVQYVLGELKPHGVTAYEAYATNVWITTSGFFSLVPFRTLLAATSIDHIMYSVDYPWAFNENGTEFMNQLKRSGLITGEEWEQIAYKNAEHLYRLG